MAITKAGEMKYLMLCEAPHAPRASLAGVLSVAYTNSMRLTLIAHVPGRHKSIDVAVRQIKCSLHAWG
jgi:hypothetical protein